MRSGKRWVIAVLGLTACALATGGGLRAQTVCFSDTFEAGLANWSLDGLWHPGAESDICGAQRAPFPAGPTCVWYGADATCTYDRPQGAPTFGYLTLVPFVQLPPPDGRPVYLRYWNAIDTEHCCDCYGYDGTNYDESRVEVQTATDPTWRLLGNDCNGQQPDPLAWHQGRMDLSSYRGQSIRVRFLLQTWDDNCNSGFGWWIDGVSIQVEAGAAFCESAPNLCPCGNGTSSWGLCPGAQDAGVGGCYHSGGRQAELIAAGTQRVGGDSVRLLAKDLPSSTTVLFAQGDAVGSGTAFGDGRRCIGGTVVRLAVRAASGGQAAYPGPGDPPVSVKGLLPPGGGTRTYQVYYRDAARFCTAATFNLTNGLSVAWAP